MIDWGYDLRHALRSLRKAPGYSAAAILTLAVGIGLNAAVLSGVYGVLLRPLDVRGASRLYTVWQDMESRGGKRQDTTDRAVFVDWRARNHSFSAMALFIRGDFDLNGLGQSVPAARVSRDFFSVLGVQPVLGRGFLREEEESKDGGRVAVLADTLWRRLGADPAIIGKQITANDLQFKVVGVLPQGFRAPLTGNAELFNVMDFSPPLKDRSYSYAWVIGRLKAGVTPAAAQADMDRVAATLAADYPQEMRGIGARIEPLLDSVVGSARRILLLLLSAVSLVLIVACLNVANLTLSRFAARRPELALRMALGASGGRMVRLFVAESTLLAAGGAILGLFLGFAYLTLLRQLAPPQTPRLDAIRLDGVVVAGVAGVALAGGLLAGLLPALWTWRRRSFGALRGAGAGTGRFALRSRGTLVAAEIAASIVLLVGAGLLVRTLAALDRVDPGFRTGKVVLGEVQMVPHPVTDRQQVAAFGARLEERLRQRPEIAAAGLVTSQPLAAGSFVMGFSLEGQTDAAEQRQGAEFRGVSPGYFTALGFPLVVGRFFDSRDTASAPPVVMVNQSFVRRYLAGRPPLGRRIRSVYNEGDDAPRRLVVGVVGDVRGTSLDRLPEPEIYLPLAQQPGYSFTVVARARTSEPAALAALQAVARELKPGQVVQRPQTMEEVLRRGLSPRRFSAGVIDTFAAVALLLAAVGIYGVTALAVAQRRRELAVRIALGAPPSSIFGLILRWIAFFILAGVAAGLAASLASGRLIAGILYGARPLDELSVAAAVALLLAVAFTAGLLPALRAAKIDPAPVLKSEI
jgi:putative ABC transport system permease protein